MKLKVGAAALAFTMFGATAIAADKPAPKTEKEKLSYSIGVQIGHDIKRNNIDLDADTFARAVRDVLAGDKTAMTEEEIKTTLQGFQQKMMEKQAAMIKELAEKNKKDSDAFLAANKKKKGVVSLPNGIQYKVIKEGKGKQPTVKDTVVAHYTGTLPNGKEFDSSVKRGEPATFPLGGVIKGWQEVLPRMKEGAKWQVVIPPELAYGERGAGQDIGPNQALVFDIELISVKQGDAGKGQADKK